MINEPAEPLLGMAHCDAPARCEAPRLAGVGQHRQTMKSSSGPSFIIHRKQPYTPGQFDNYCGSLAGPSQHRCSAPVPPSRAGDQLAILFLAYTGVR
jgi:hypothetical protein